MKKRRNLALLLLILGIGFAAITITLNINGGVAIKGNTTDFDVRFTKAILGTDDISTSAISSDGRTITYTTEELSNIGDKSVLKYTVKNNSAYFDADVSVNCTSIGEHNDYYSISNNIKTPIEAKNSKKGTLTVTVIKSSTVDINEEFSCTLEANSVDRTTEGVEKPDLADVLQVGDYVSMTPSGDVFTPDSEKTGYTGTDQQEIDPKELTLWRIIRKNDDGTYDAVSDYTTSKQVYFEGSTGYANYVGYLNEIAKKYENSKYTTGSRCMGYNGQTEYIEEKRYFIEGKSNTAFKLSSIPEGTDTEPLGGGDNLYETDVNLVTSLYSNLNSYIAGTYTVADNYWLASRSASGDCRYYSGRRSGGAANLISDNTLDRIAVSSSSYFRPIITLSDDITYSDGTGELATPYVLS